MAKKIVSQEPKFIFRTNMITPLSKVLKITRKPGYVIVKMLVDDREYGGDGQLPMTAAFTTAGHYIGTVKMAKRLVEKYGIVPECRRGLTVCTIGWSARRKKWYGWSHRAIAGFGMGSIVRKGDVIAKAVIGNPRRGFATGYRPKTVADCKRMALVFAEEVS